jgi:hypothetical protein
MKIAKPSKYDCQKLWDLYHLVEELSEDCEHEPTREKLERALRKAHQGVMGRVVFGMETLIDNNIFNPALPQLDLHPRFAHEEVEPMDLW